MTSVDPALDGALPERGRSALARGSWEEALELLGAAIEGDATDAAAWESFAIACAWLQDTDRAIEARQHAYALFREAGDDIACARVSLDLASDYFEVRGEMAVANGWFQRARRLLDALPPTREHALLRIWDAYMALMGENDPFSAVEHAREAGALAEETDASDIGVLALALEGLARVTGGEAARGLSLLDEAVAGAISGEFADPQWYYLTCCCMIDACDRVRDYGRSLQWCGRLREFSERRRVQAFLTTCRVKYTGALLWRGEWGTCEAELERAIAESLVARPPSVAGAAVRLADLRRRQGRVPEAEKLLDQANGHPMALAVRAALAADRGDAEAALNLLDRGLRRTPASARTERLAALELKVRLHANLGEPDLAAEAARELESIALVIGTRALRAASLTASALVAAAASDHDRARELLEDALDIFMAEGSIHQAAGVRLDLARSLAALGRPYAAAGEISTALEVLDLIGAAVEVRRGRALLAGIDPNATADIDNPRTMLRGVGPRHGILTPRQREVLTLVAQGLSERDVAGRLFLSEHTVHRHVANIFHRLGVSSRSAAVARALRDDLI